MNRFEAVGLALLGASQSVFVLVAGLLVKKISRDLGCSAEALGCGV